MWLFYISTQNHEHLSAAVTAFTLPISGDWNPMWIDKAWITVFGLVHPKAVGWGRGQSSTRPNWKNH